MTHIFKRYLEIEAIFTKREINNKWNFNFPQNMTYIFKRYQETEAVFTKTEINYKWNNNFFLNHDIYL